MREVNRLVSLLFEAAGHCDPRGTAMAIGRSALAAAQLSVITFSPDAVLFVDAVAPPDGMRCTGLRTTSLWCLAGSTDFGLLISRTIAIVVLVVVLSGYRPKWTCVPHWYVAFSLAASMPMPNGGEYVVQAATMLLLPMYLGDDRAWHWTRPVTPLPPQWRGAAYAAQLVTRGQIFIIYVTAVISKLMDPLWRNGTAMHVVAHDPLFGFSQTVHDVLGPVFSSYWPVAIVSWAAIGLQLVIAFAILGGRRSRTVALLLGIALHVSIIVLLRLPSFGIAMVGLLAIGWASSRSAPHTGRPRESTEERKSV